MQVLKANEAISYNGGGKITTGIAVIITGVVVFVMGIIDGLTNPKKCNVGR